MIKKAIFISFILFVSAGIFVVASQRYNKDNENVTNNTSQLAPPQNDPNKHDSEDVDFAKKMILVDQQAMQIADMGIKNASDVRIRDLATKIYNDAQSDSQSYVNWLTQWNESYFNLTDFPESEGHDMYPTFTGMISLSKIKLLEASVGIDFDKAFIGIMIEHHKGMVFLQTDSNSEGAMVGYGDIIEIRNKYVKNLNQQIDELEQINKDKGY